MEDFDLEDQLQEEESYYHELMLQEEESYDQELIEQDNMDRNISHEKHSSVSVSSPSSSSGVQNALNQEGSHQSRNKSSNLNMKPPHLIERLQPISQSLFPYSGLVTQLPSYRSIDSTKCLRDRPPLGEEYESITLPNGKRKYLYFRKTEPKSLFSERESLLSKPMEEILKEAEQRKITALSSYEENTIPEARDLFFGDQSKAHVKSQQLWVDKYSPKSFSQLLSPEKLNREVLRSIKMWDQYVFDRDVAHLTTKSEEGHNSNKGVNHSDPELAVDEELIHHSDNHRKDKRPFFKVLLLTGPPGTGKTTLAHIVATHCGYRPIEMNASDDRTVDALKDIISRSMANTTLNNFSEASENRPNCLILDEIDGMDGRAPIDALVSIIKTPLQSQEAKRKSGKGRIALTRPLICICNDQYSPILKELRAVAKVFPFSPPTELRLVQRLKQICQNEGLSNISTTALTALCQSCNLDIRSAINTLQFASLKCSHNHLKFTEAGDETVDRSYEVNHILTSMLLSGSKDERQDIFKLWRNIFTVTDNDLVTKRLALLSAVQHTNSSPYHQSSSSSSSSSSSATTSKTKSTLLLPRNYQTYRSSNCMEIFDNVLNFSDNQLVISGIHENYLTIRYTDPTFQRTYHAAEWLSLGDIFEGKLYSNDMNSHSLSNYIPSIASAIHLICSTDSKGYKLQFPSKDRHYYFLKTQKENILQNFSDGSLKNIQNLPSKHICAIDIIPFLLEIITLSGAIPVRSGARHLLTPIEIARIKEVATIMASYGLQYEKRRTSATNATGKYSKQNENEKENFELEPAINLLTSSYEFHEDEKKKSSLSNESKLNLFLEIRSIMLKQMMQNQHQITSEGDSVVPGHKGNEGGEEGRGIKRGLPVENSIESSRPSEVIPNTNTKKIKVSGSMTSFIKSKNSLTSPSNKKSSENIKGKSSGVRFKFNQGFTNAVKRPVKITEFLS